MLTEILFKISFYVMDQLSSEKYTKNHLQCPALSGCKKKMYSTVQCDLQLGGFYVVSKFSELKLPLQGL